MDFDKHWHLNHSIMLGANTAIAVSGIALAVIAECVSQKQRIALDWDLQDILSGGMVNVMLMTSVIIALFYAGMLMKITHGHLLKHLTAMARNLEYGIMTPVIFEAFSLFQADIFKSVVATIIYLGGFLFVMTELVFVLSLMHDMIDDVLYSND